MCHDVIKNGGDKMVVIGNLVADILYAVVDPEDRLKLDVFRSNNSRSLKRESHLPAAKWSSKWMIWLQDMLAGFASFI